MQPIRSGDGLAALSAFTPGNTWLIFFVDGGDETARHIAAVLKSCSDTFPDKNIVVMSTQYHSVLHMQFEVVYGPTPVNTVTFISKRGGAVIRWSGHGNIEDIIEEIFGIDSISDADLCEFGYPTEESERHLMLGNSVNDEVLLANGSVSPLEREDKEQQPIVEQENVEKEIQPSLKKLSVEKGMQPNVEKGMQPNVEKGMQLGADKEIRSSGSSGKKSSQGQPKEVTILQIRCPDGSSVTKSFKTSSLLSEVREMIAAHFSLSDGFGLATSFPRYHYVNEDYGRNLSDLDLWPNAVLLIVPADPRQENNNTSLWGYTANFNSWAYTLIMYVWNRISSFFPFTGGGNSQPETQTSDGQTSPQPGPSGSRRRGNIHTLRDTEKDDDKRRTTYNGNSTQQL